MTRLRWATALLRWIVPADRREDVLGDLCEAHSRRAQRLNPLVAYLATSWEALLVAGAFVLYRWREARWALFDWATGSEIKLALRLMKRQPLFAATAVLSLSIGLALTTLGLSVLEGTTFAKLPFEGGDRYVRISAHTEPEGHPVDLDAEHFRLFREQARSLSFVGAVGGAQVNLGSSTVDKSSPAAIDSVRANLVTPSSLTLIGAHTILGQSFDGDAATGDEATVWIRDSLWQRRWHRAEQTIGSLVSIDGIDHTVAGVFADDLEFPSGGELWIPVTDDLTTSVGIGAQELVIFGVLAENETVQQAAIELDHLLSAMRLTESNTGLIRSDVRSYTEAPPGWSLGMSVLILVLMSILLVIASNVANLIYARTAARSSEMAVRTALGAPRRRLIGQIFVEVAAMALLAAVLGALFANAVLKRAATQFDELPFWIDLSPGPRTLAITLAMALVASAVAGVLPALRATRRDPARGLKVGARGSTFGRAGRLAIVSQMALSIALLTGALVFARGFVLHSAPSDSLPRGTILTAQLTGVTDSDPLTTIEAALDSIATENETSVEAFGLASYLPRIDPPLQHFLFENSAENAESRVAPVAWISPGFLETLGGSPLTGRLFRDQDLEPRAPRVAIVNNLFVDRFLSGTNPVGRRIVLQVNSDSRNLIPIPESPSNERTYEIVGVVADLGLSASDPDSAAGLYLPMQPASLYYLSVLTDGNPMALEPALRTALSQIAPALQLRRVQPLESVGSEDRAMMTGFGSALTGLGLVALLLSLVGIYSMMSFAVTRRTREIGIRIALGATRRQVLVELVASSAVHLAVGAAIGTALAAVVLRATSGVLVTRLPTAEPWILPVVVLSMLMAGAIACYLPARKALGTHPSDALRLD